MKDISQRGLESSRPNVDAEDTLKFCLEQLYADDLHEIEEEVVADLTFEELIGALLQGLDLAVEKRRRGYDAEDNS